MNIAKKLLSLSLLAALALLASCSATGKFKPIGRPPVWQDNTELPPPTDGTVELGTITVTLQCPTMEEDDEYLSLLREAVVNQCRQAGMGDVRLLPRGTGKKAQYEILVYEAGEDGKFEFNTEAGIWAGVGTGVATGILTESVGTGVAAGAGGAAVAGLLFGEKKEIYAFAGLCRQRTSLTADKTASGNSDTNAQSGGGIKDQDIGSTTSGGTSDAMLTRTHWNLKTQSYDFPFMFSIAVAGGSMSNKATRDAAAREVFLKKFPRYVTGGTSL